MMPQTTPTPPIRIALLPGDGIGPEVMKTAIHTLDAVGFTAEYEQADVGWSFWKTEGNALPQRTHNTLSTCTAALFGAIESKGTDEAEAELAPTLRGQGLYYTSPIVQIRQQFDLYAAIRPCRSIPINPTVTKNNIDIVVFRENTEGLYGGIEWHPIPEALAHQMADPQTGHPKRMQRWIDTGLDTVALSTRFTSKKGCERIIRAAFEFACKHHRQSVTLIEKPNVLRKTGGMMTRAFRTISPLFPDISAHEMNVDAACMQLVREPHEFDVIVAENMFGDIVSDLAAGLTGGLGFAPSANIGDTFALFEPTHGIAPTIAGKGIANPVAMIQSAAMMLDYLGQSNKAIRIQNAIQTAFLQGKINTPDVAGSNAQGTTESVANAIIEAL